MSLSSRFRLTGFRQLSRAWTEIEQTALSRITGRARPGLPPMTVASFVSK